VCANVYVCMCVCLCVGGGGSLLHEECAGHGPIPFLKLHFNTHFTLTTPLGKLS